MIGVPTLIPLASGGVVATVRQWGIRDTVEGKQVSKLVKMFGIDAEGELMWEQRFPTSLSDWTFAADNWLLTDQGLLFTSRARDAGIWTINELGSTSWDAPIGGRLVRSGDFLFIYDDEGIYLLNPERRETDLIFPLPRAFPDLGDMVALSGGGLLLAHPDYDDRRLIALDNQGNLKWQRSYADSQSGSPRLLSLAGDIYLALLNDTSSASEITIYAIRSDGEELIHLFSGGTRSSVAGNISAIAPDGDRILIDAGGGSIAVLDVKQALEADAGHQSR
jgi:hypothetical protein